MRFFKNYYFDLLDNRFIPFEWNSLTVTPSVMCFTPNSEAENNYQIRYCLHSDDLNTCYVKVHIDQSVALKWY